MEQYVRWYNGSSIMDFYTNPAIVEAFKTYVDFVITRVNALTGIPYAEDPAILAWDLCNEPQAPGDDTGDILQVTSVKASDSFCMLVSVRVLMR